MKIIIKLGIAMMFGIAAANTDLFARGFGGFGGGGFGGMHAGGFGGGMGGFHAGGFGGGDLGGFHAGGFDAGGFHAGGLDASGFRAGSFNANGIRTGDLSGNRGAEFGSGAYRGGDWGGSLNRGTLNSFLGLPTDAGMHVADIGSISGDRFVPASEGAAAWRGGAAGHVYQGPMGTTVAHGAAGVQGVAAGPAGIAGGGRVASGTVVKGPEDNVYARGATAGRGFAAGPGGVVAGRGVAAGRGFAGAYGTRYFSPTYCHAQGLAAQRWSYGNSVFRPEWCSTHPWAWCPAGYTAAAWASAAWRATTWPAIGTWLAWDAPPSYYDYGDNITYQDDTVYYGSQPIESADNYYQQAVNLAGSNAATEPAKDEKWLPLGVFGLMAEGQSTPEMVFQLALDKAGDIRGNYYDQVTDATASVSGSVNKKDQRVAFRVGTNKNMVVETGLYNLTQDQSTALVHFGPDRTQQFVLVRVKPPADAKEGPKSSE
jgi:hypothetical protein